ncbi:MAG: hypothetical protein HY908_08550, partial [Myxococcales bacterium]|nr:hypothetical protein [Myxococcales bacterium]
SASRPPELAPVPTPIACGPRPSYPPVEYVMFRTTEGTTDGTAVRDMPQLATSDPALAPSLLAAQAELAKLATGSGLECAARRNDGELLAFHCAQGRSGGGMRTDTTYLGYNYTRVADRFEPLDLRAIGRSSDDAPRRIAVGSCLPHEPAAALAAVATGLGLDSEWAFELHGRALVAHVSSASMGALGTYACSVPYAKLAPWLGCATLLDEPPALAALPVGDPPPLAFGVHVDDDFLGSSPGFATLYPELASADPRRRALATRLDDELQAWLAAARTTAPAGTSTRVRCDVYASTKRAVSVLCRLEGANEIGQAVATAKTVTYRLGPKLTPVTVDELLRGRAGAAGEIAQRCLARWVRPQDNAFDEVLPKLPTLTRRDLEAFGLLGNGVLFAIPIATLGGFVAGQTRLESCFVPYAALGTNLDALSRGP